MPAKLKQTFFNVSCKDLAISLLGKMLVRKLDNGEILKGRIVETECYPGGEDKASKSYMGRRTKGNEPMYMEAGTSYVYMTYGMYYCFNISSAEPGAAVLIRAIEPIVGAEEMLKLRQCGRKSVSKKLKDTEIGNGPSKLCTAMNINKTNCNMLNLDTDKTFWLEDDQYNVTKMISTSRIGIASAGTLWASKPYRFYVCNNPHVSKRDQLKENDSVSHTNK
ncbi:PREDICTED: DNA-3-methyladenine glycosylase-like [Nicrophorus vespilloides]|uniref:DNA-3-methyladenine glycosylase II n=1 Tax=Nicrophorus vespilloides TaxID=110193 RepID=A0ABM1N3T4_NICVS|nr:PREDICTED: DNA-3-methyladenine glycosylase-like [Nicrophorus vespilloides]